MSKRRDWVTLHVPRRVAEAVGTTSLAHGVAAHQAIAAALWAFSRLSLEERGRLISDYLLAGAAESLRGE